MLSETPHPVYLKDYRPPEFLVDSVDLAFDLNEEQTQVHARLSLRRNPEASKDDDTLALQGERLDLQGIWLDGQPLTTEDYRLNEIGLEIPSVPERFTLETRVRIQPRDNTALEGLYMSDGMFCTQCEAEGFRRITYFLDRPDVMSRFTTRITADPARYPVMLSNGNAVETWELPDGRHGICWEDPYPKPCYLFALVAGDLAHIEDLYTTASGRKVKLSIYVEPSNIDRCDHAMASLKKAMQWDETEYGREYDLDIYMIVAVNDFNMGAMENKGLNVFNSKYVLARPETATDQDYQDIEGVIAHEYFHNWTGNRITCRDWFQLSLKEGLTVFRDQEFSADMGSRAVKRIEDVRFLLTHQFAEDAGPMAHPVRPDSYIEINNFYTVTVYNKGAELIRMQRNLLGTEGFRRGMDLYFQRHDGQAVTTDDFVRSMEDANGRDLRQFRRWYSQAGTPRLQVDGSYDADQSTYRLRVRQNRPPSPDQTPKAPFHIPLQVGLLTPDGSELPLRLEGEAAAVGGSRMLELKADQESFCFVDVPALPTPSLLRGFSAPVIVDFDYRDQDLIFLLAHDQDEFNRWDAAQKVAQRVILRMLREHREGRPMEVPEGLLAAFAKVLGDPAVDPALRAELLTLPSEAYLGELMETVDVDGIHVAREHFRATLAGSLREPLLKAYRKHAESSGYDLTPDAIARRALKNTCLGLLMQLDDPQIRELCLRQYWQANNMTDSIASLTALANADCPERSQALDDFAHRWGEDNLVMDKWFSIQALSKLPDSLQRVESLMSHPAFSLHNPNKVRSLIGAFCSGNTIRFHALNGAGYRFLTERVLELDPLNPQIAARLARALIRWRHYDINRQALMQAQLERILRREPLSRDLYEVVSKALQAD